MNPPDCELQNTGVPESTLERISKALAAAETAEECLELAEAAEQIGAMRIRSDCLHRAVAINRDCQAALLALAAMAMDDGEPTSIFVPLEEAARSGLLPDSVETLRRDLFTRIERDPMCDEYLRAIGCGPDLPTDQPLNVVLVTNLFPPQELGGYGRMMWEFAYGLRARGHKVSILTANVPELGKAPTLEETELETCVVRALELTGTWVGGIAKLITDPCEQMRRVRDNAARVRTAVTKSKADLVLAGNLDFLGIDALRPALLKRIPVLHALANAAPGYAPAQQPSESNYWVAPCSDWNGEVFARAGFSPARIETLYPGARIDRFFRFFLPDTHRLRICYASLVLPYKGANTLIEALVRLHHDGVDFTAEIAGDAPDAAFLATLQQRVNESGIGSRVRFTGFLDRRGLSSLFARSNVLVFPSRFEEPFGISQVEAMAAGLVVVSSGTGGAKEIIRDGKDGLLFSAGQDDDLAEKLARLQREPLLMTELQRQGQIRSLCFSASQAVQKIECLAHEMRRNLASDNSDGGLGLPDSDLTVGAF